MSAPPDSLQSVFDRAFAGLRQGRDTFTGYDGAPAKATGRAAWWTWLNLDTADRVKVDGKAFPAAAADKVVPEAEMPALRGKTVEMGTSYGASTWFWFDPPSALDLKAVITFKAPVAPNYHHRTFGKSLGVLVVARADRPPAAWRGFWAPVSCGGTAPHAGLNGRRMSGPRPS